MIFIEKFFVKRMILNQIFLVLSDFESIFFRFVIFWINFPTTRRTLK